MLVTADSLIEEVVQRLPRSAEVFARFGMDCQGCTAAERETVGQGAERHGANLTRLLATLNALPPPR